MPDSLWKYFLEYMLEPTESFFQWGHVGELDVNVRATRTCLVPSSHAGEVTFECHTGTFISVTYLEIQRHQQQQQQGFVS